MEKLEWLGYQKVKKIEDIFIRFGATHERDGRTDRQTPGDCIPRLCIASRGKKSKRCRHIKPRHTPNCMVLPPGEFNDMGVLVDLWESTCYCQGRVQQPTGRIGRAIFGMTYVRPVSLQSSVFRFISCWTTLILIQQNKMATIAGR